MWANWIMVAFHLDEFDGTVSVLDKIIRPARPIDPGTTTHKIMQHNLFGDVALLLISCLINLRISIKLAESFGCQKLNLFCLGFELFIPLDDIVHLEQPFQVVGAHS